MSGKTTKGASISHRKEVHSYYYPVRTGRSNASYRNTLFRTCSGSACFAAVLSGVRGAALQQLPRFGRRSVVSDPDLFAEALLDAVEGRHVDPCFAAQDVTDSLPRDVGVAGDFGFATGSDHTGEIFRDLLEDESLGGRVLLKVVVWPCASGGEVVLWVGSKFFAGRHSSDTSAAAEGVSEAGLSVTPVA